MSSVALLPSIEHVSECDRESEAERGGKDMHVGICYGERAGQMSPKQQPLLSKVVAETFRMHVSVRPHWIGSLSLVWNQS